MNNLGTEQAKYLRKCLKELRTIEMSETITPFFMFSASEQARKKNQNLENFFEENEN